MLTPTYFAQDVSEIRPSLCLIFYQISDSRTNVLSFIDEHYVLTSLVEVVVSQFRMPLVPSALNLLLVVGWVLCIVLY